MEIYESVLTTISPQFQSILAACYNTDDGSVKTE